MEVKIIHSQKRQKTISARMAGDTMFVYAPLNISEARLKKIIHNFKARFKRHQLKKELNKKEDLMLIACELNKKYFGGQLKINSIEYVTNQNKKFGCCNYAAKTIRISHRLQAMPQWVRDYVIVHELAHLVEPNHNKSFWDIVSRYKLTERARGYLMAKGFDDEFIKEASPHLGARKLKELGAASPEQQLQDIEPLNKSLREIPDLSEEK